MMTTEEIESACAAAQPPDFSRHELEPAEMRLQRTFHVMGFPVEVRTNDVEVLSVFETFGGAFRKRFNVEPIRVEVHVVDSDSLECPPTPTHNIVLPLVVWVADPLNFGIVDMERRSTKVVVSRGSLRFPLYLQYFFLEPAASCHISTQFTTPVHGGCVALEGRGVLLCGDSGAGKSTLSWACARAGWDYITDDASCLLHGEGDRLVMGNCYQVRFRPSAAELFSEVAGLEITPRAEGKPSIELPTARIPQIRCVETAEVDFIVFLNRSWQGEAELVPYRKDAARHYLRQVLFGTPELLAVQYAAVERLLTAEVFELRYTALDSAIERLRTLVIEGH